MPFIDIATGANLQYEHDNPESTKTPVLMLHGMLGTSRNQLGDIIDWLVGEGYEVYAPTLRGYGESTPKPRDFPYEFYKRDAQDVLAFMDAVGLQKCHVLGYSDGGEIAFICAGTQPERFASVATIGSVGYFDEKVRIVVQGYRPGHKWISQEELDEHGIPDADEFARQWQRSTLMLVDAGGDVAVSLAKNITMPVLVMLGERDSLNPPANAQKFLDAGVANGRIQVFDSGHPIHEEQTAEFKQAYLAHIQSAE